MLPRKLALDLQYVEHHSVAGDLRILGQTFLFAISRWFRGR
jgi:lipopolysaccharide/colanic/teichoic acid biosynthesis glycosyltransferase